MLIGDRLIVIANSYFETISYWTEKVGLTVTSEDLGFEVQKPPGHDTNWNYRSFGHKWSFSTFSVHDNGQ